MYVYMCVCVCAFVCMRNVKNKVSISLFLCMWGSYLVSEYKITSKKTTWDCNRPWHYHAFSLVNILLIIYICTIN